MLLTASYNMNEHKSLGAKYMHVWGLKKEKVLLRNLKTLYLSLLLPSAYKSISNSVEILDKEIEAKSTLLWILTFYHRFFSEFDLPFPNSFVR